MAAITALLESYGSLPLHPAERNFANPARFVQSWYPVLESDKLRPGSVQSVSLLGRKLAVFRTESGKVNVIDARCPHLGADLGLGTVQGEKVRCAFHGWCISAGGEVDPASECASRSKRQRSYPVTEEHGLIWFYNGETPLFPIPRIAPDLRTRLRLPPQRIRCHPHLVLGNGLDLDHFDTLHGFELTRAPEVFESGPYSLSVTLAGRPRSRLLTALIGCKKREMLATFSTIGASMATAEIFSPTRFTVLFTGKPDENGCLTKTTMFVASKNPLSIARNLVVLLFLLRSDRKVLDGISFTPNFTESDSLLERYALLVDSLPVG